MFVSDYQHVQKTMQLPNEKQKNLKKIKSVLETVVEDFMTI